MPEAQNISHQESFLFQFANIHCIKKTFSCYRPEKKLNRTPTKEPEVIPIPDGKLNRSIVVDGTIYDIKDDKPVCIGNTFFNPELFEAFCHQNGIEGVSNDQGLILWEHCQQALKAMVDNDYSAIQYWFRHIKERPDICLPNKGGKETFEAKIYIPLLEFLYERVQTVPVRGSIFLRLHDKRNGISSFKQCACCGSFWIEPEQGKEGKPRSVFCSDECNDFFHQPTREKNAKSSKKSKEFAKKIQAGKDCKRISEIYQHNGYGKADAEKRAKQWVYVQRKSFKQFRRKEGSYSGEGLDLSGF